jgi:hypothetical protein
LATPWLALSDGSVRPSGRSLHPPSRAGLAALAAQLCRRTLVLRVLRRDLRRQTAAPITSAGRFSPLGSRGIGTIPLDFAFRSWGQDRESCSCFHHQSIGTTPQIACARRRRLKLRVARPSTSRWPKYGLGSPTKPRADAGGQTPRLGRSYNLCSRLRPPQRIDFSQ